MLENKNKNKNKKLFFEIIKINIKNLDIKPNKGGIPANDNKINVIKTVIKGKLPKNFRSERVFKYFKSNKKNIKKILNNINI